MNDLVYMAVPALLGGVFGSSLYRIVYVRPDTPALGPMACILGAVAGGFLGSFAGMMTALAFSKSDTWPLNYWISTILATAFTLGFLKFIRDNIEK